MMIESIAPCRFIQIRVIATNEYFIEGHFTSDDLIDHFNICILLKLFYHSFILMLCRPYPVFQYQASSYKVTDYHKGDQPAFQYHFSNTVRLRCRILFPCGKSDKAEPYDHNKIDACMGQCFFNQVISFSCKLCKIKCSCNDGQPAQYY